MLHQGDKAPDFTAQTNLGNEITLSKIGSKFIILYFYPKDSTPGCTVQACSIRDNLQNIEKFDAKVFGISQDSLKSHLKFTEKENLNFPLIVDETKEICTKYGVLKEKSMFGKKYLGVERTTFILDKDLNIIKVYEKVSPVGHAKLLLDTLQNLNN